MQKIREQVLVHRDQVYQDNEGEVRKRWQFEDAVSFFLFHIHSEHGSEPRLLFDKYDASF